MMDRDPFLNFDDAEETSAPSDIPSAAGANAGGNDVDGSASAQHSSLEDRQQCSNEAAGPTTGITRLPSAKYHADPAPKPSLSTTLAKLLLTKSPKHAWCASRRLNPDYVSVDKKTFDIGRAAHRAVLGFGDDYVAIPEHVLAKNGAASTDAAKAFIASCREQGRVPLKDEEVDKIEQMRRVAHARLAEHGVTLDPDRSELCAFAEIDGVWCRAMFDNVPVDPTAPIYDFKTCEDASPEACLKSIINYGYDVQAVHYRDVWRTVTGELRDFVFIFQEKSEPHEVTLVKLSGSFHDLAERRVARARRLWGKCVTANLWPGYPIGMHEVDPPAWLVERSLAEAM